MIFAMFGRWRCRHCGTKNDAENSCCDICLYPRH